MHAFGYKHDGTRGFTTAHKATRYAKLSRLLLLGALEPLVMYGKNAREYLRCLCCTLIVHIPSGTLQTLILWLCEAIAVAPRCWSPDDSHDLTSHDVTRGGNSRDSHLKSSRTSRYRSGDLRHESPLRASQPISAQLGPAYMLSQVLCHRSSAGVLEAATGWCN